MLAHLSPLKLEIVTSYLNIFRSVGVVIETPHSIAQLRLGCSLRLDCCALFVRGSVSSSAMPITAFALHARGAVLAHVALHRGCHAQEPAAFELAEDDDRECPGLTQIDQDRLAAAREFPAAAVKQARKFASARGAASHAVHVGVSRTTHQYHLVHT